MNWLFEAHFLRRDTMLSREGLVLSQFDKPDFVDSPWEALLTLSEEEMDD